MFYNRNFAGQASRRYQAVNAGRVESASPHELVKILFEELLLAIDAGVIAIDLQDDAKANEKLVRALSILQALDSSLDFEKGGEVAVSLAQVYRESRRLLLIASQHKSAPEARDARDIIAEIADAWARIG